MATTHYLIRPTGESSVSLEIHRNGLRRRKHVLFFRGYNGELVYDPEDLASAAVSISVDLGSMICRDAWLKPAEREAVAGLLTDLFNAQEFPQLSFSTQSVAGISRHRAEVKGAIIVRGASASTSFDATIVPVGKDQLELDLRGALNLSNHAIESPKTLFGRPRFQDTARLRLLLWPARGSATCNHRPAEASAGARNGK